MATIDSDAPMASSGPVEAHERIDLLDAVRGVALGGILLANLMSFLGADMLSPEARRAQPLGAAGGVVLVAVNWLVEGKFYSVFSMLFGAGFALQAARAARRGEQLAGFHAFFYRRMAVLVVIGLVHMYVLWAGDILALYGVMGLLLPTVARWSPRARALTVATLFAVPLLTHAAVVATEGRADPRAPFAALGAHVRDRMGIADRDPLDVFARRGPSGYAAWNVSYAVTRPGTYLQSGRPAKVLALFLIGAWLATAVLHDAHRRRRALAWTVAVGGATGLAFSGVYAAIKADTGSTFLVSDLGLVQTAAYTLGTTPLALAYLAAAVLLWEGRRGRAVMGWFVPLGRMALSVYLTQTLVQLALFSGYGAGLAGDAPIAALPAVASLLVVLQRAACVWWLRRHAQGPVEWLWRRCAYGRLPSSGLPAPSVAPTDRARTTTR